jgi:hypothetical protein
MDWTPAGDSMAQSAFKKILTAAQYSFEMREVTEISTE